MRQVHHTSRHLIAIMVMALQWPCQTVRAIWFDNSWTFRRSVEAVWDGQSTNADALCMAEFYSAGHTLPGGQDIRVATAGGRVVASRVLDIAGDRVRVAFAMPNGEKNFFIYFGNEKPAAPPASAA